MAYTTHNASSFSPLSAIRDFFSAIGRALVLSAEMNPRMQQVQKLQAMSDAELAERGIRREDIVRVVFKDVLFV